LNVNRLTLTPLNAWDGAGVAGPAEAEASLVAAGADAGADAAADAAALGAADGVAGLQPVMTSIKPTTGAMDLNRDTGVLLLTRPRSSSILNDWR
jgi:hypothetical protein